jgi:hypothetical protein
MNGDVVSTNTSYGFTVQDDTELYARFRSTGSGTLKLYPNSVYNISSQAVSTVGNKGYTDSSNTDDNNRTTINLARGEKAETIVYFGFDTSSIPADAVIESVSCTFMAYVSTGTTARVCYRVAQLSSGENMKGGPAFIVTSKPSTATTITNCGTWTRDEINDIRLRFDAVRGTSNLTSSYYIYFYGATLTINYSYGYIVDGKSSVTGSSVTPSTQYIANGGSTTLRVNSYDTSSSILTDNENAVESASLSSVGVVKMIPNWLDYTPGSTYFTFSTSYPPGNAYESTDNPTNNYLRLQIPNASGSAEAYLGFETWKLSEIPSNATIDSVTCKIRLKVNNATRVAGLSIQLYSGTTAKGTAYETRSVTVSTVSITAGSWTLAELKSARLRIYGIHDSGSSAGYIQIYAGDISVSYTLPNGSHNYTIGNVVFDHTVKISPVS